MLPPSPHLLLTYINCLAVIRLELFSFNEALHKKTLGGRVQNIFPKAICETKHCLIYIELSSLSACHENLAIVELKSLCIAF